MRSKGILRPEWGSHGVVLAARPVRAQRAPRSLTGPGEHGQSHIMPAVIVRVRRTSHPIWDGDQHCARLIDGWQPWSLSQMRDSPGALGACAAPMTWVQNAAHG